MAERPEGNDERANGELCKRIGAAERRRLRGRRQRRRTVWFGLGMMGLIGWSVALPTLAAIAVGVWLDKLLPGRHSWTLMMVFVGIAIGCLNAWYWVLREGRSIEPEDDETND